MIYTKIKIKELLENSSKNQNIKQAADAQSGLLQLFLNPKFDKDSIKNDNTFKEYIEKPIESRIGRKKTKRIMDFVTLPLKANLITEQAKKDLFRVYNAGNSVIKYSVASDTSAKKLDLAVEKNELNQTVVDISKEAITYNPSIITVVLRNGNDGLPFIIKVSSEQIIDGELKNYGDNAGLEFKYLAFKDELINSKGERLESVVFIDTEKIEVYWKLNKDANYVLANEYSYNHNLGYCPARFFNPESIDKKGLVKRNQFSLALGELIKYTQFDIFSFYSDHFVPFPVTEVPKIKCGNSSCVDGVIEQADGEKVSCAKCNEIHEALNVGIGTKVEIIPNSEGKTLGGTYRFISPPIEGSEYLDSKQVKREEFILTSIRGVANGTSKEAINELQATGNFESQNNVLLELKQLLDRYHYWVLYTFAKLIDTKLEPAIHIDYGTEFYLQDESEMQDEYKQAKESGLPTIELQMYYDRLIQKKFKNTPDKLKYVEMVNIIDPMPFDSYDEKVAKMKDGAVSMDDFKLSVNLLKYIERFEREEAISILEYGEKKDIDAKVKEIVNKLKSYIYEQN